MIYGTKTRLDLSAPTERQLQRSVVPQLRAVLGGNFIVLAIPNQRTFPIPPGATREAGARIRHAILTALIADGMQPGAHDLLVGHGGRCLLIELKSERHRRGASLLPSQIEFHAAAEAAGMEQATCATPEAVFAAVALWCARHGFAMRGTLTGTEKSTVIADRAARGGRFHVRKKHERGSI